MNERDKTHASFQNVVMPPEVSLESREIAALVQAVSAQSVAILDMRDQLDRIEQALKALLAR